RNRRGPSLILVTHHVEEILPMVTHALLLKHGHVHAAGPIDQVLTSSKLSAAFGASMRLRKVRERYELRMAQPRRHGTRSVV
ncbi:MAG TPA: hypothetical protein VFV83_07195, partial [Chthoniobacteraceae bacterium]|nr:hypothetical protein [Chthoniobacteraceae bacterium]